MNPILDLYNKINHYGNHNGMTYKVLKPGEIEYKMVVQEIHLSGPGVAHGGLVAGFMDAVLGVAALSLAVETGQLVSTVEYKINFLKPVKLGETITGKGTVDSQGKRLIVCSGSIYDANNELLAKAIGTFNSYPVDKIKAKVGELFTW